MHIYSPPYLPCIFSIWFYIQYEFPSGPGGKVSTNNKPQVSTVKLPEELEIVLLIFITTWSATEPKDTCVVDWLSPGWYLYIYIRYIFIHSWKFKAGWFTSNKINWKGTSSEPKLHVGFPGWHVKVLRPCSYIPWLNQVMKGLLQWLHCDCWQCLTQGIWHGTVWYIYMIWYWRYHVDMYWCFNIHECVNSTLDEA